MLVNYSAEEPELELELGRVRLLVVDSVLLLGEEIVIVVLYLPLLPVQGLIRLIYPFFGERIRGI